MAGEIAGVILAGGRSSRMGGRDKAFAMLAGRPLIQHAVDRLAPQVTRLAINANRDADAFSAYGVPVIADDDDSRSGPLAGVLAGLRWAGGLANPPAAVVTVAVDTPFFPENLVARMQDTACQAAPGTIVLAASAGARHPTFGLWPLAVAESLAAFMTEGRTFKVTAFVDAHPHATVSFEDGGPDPFFNVNGPDDLAAAEAWLERTP